MPTEQEWHDARRERTRYTRGVAAVGILSFAVFTLPAMVIATTVNVGPWRYALGAAATIAIGGPCCVLMMRSAERATQKADDSLRETTRDLDHALERQEFESRLANALDMAEGEVEVLEVFNRSLATTLGTNPAELLLADNSQAHLMRMTAVGFEADHLGCSVDSPASCPAARRAQIQVFQDSDALDACPKLRHRSPEPISALCVPVAIMGRTVGVIHSTANVGRIPTEDEVQDLGTLAKLSGARLGMIRAMAESQLQAATDPLTGLLNRRSFEEKMIEAQRAHPVIGIAMADLDHFKDLNDTYGHETGDRALRTFARVLSESLRHEDIVCRFGGEEFAVALPGCGVNQASRILDSVRSRLDAAVTVSGLPKFTVSIGVSDFQRGEELPHALARADSALFSAKDNGRNQVVSHEEVEDVAYGEECEVGELSSIGPDLIVSHRERL